MASERGKKERKRRSARVTKKRKREREREEKTRCAAWFSTDTRIPFLLAIEDRRHSNGPRSARSRYTTVRHSAPRGDFRPATGSETHVFGRVCSHNTICLCSLLPTPLTRPSSRSFPPSRALALQCVPYSTAGKKKSEHAVYM